jgi:hypothetical protein
MIRGRQSKCDSCGFFFPYLFPVDFFVDLVSRSIDPRVRLGLSARPLWAILGVESWTLSLRPRRISEFRSSTPTGMAV